MGNISPVQDGDSSEKQTKNNSIIIIIVVIIKTPKQAISNYTKALFFHKLSGRNNRPSFDHGRKGGFSLKVR